MREFVEDAYRLVLGRSPDPDALAWAVGELERGSLSPAGLVAELVASAEFARLRALEDAVALARQARLEQIRPRELTAPPGTEERLIEIPWVLARYAGEPRVLDVGFANADAEYLAALVDAAPDGVVGVDPVAADREGVRGVVGDMRALPFEDGAFDVVLCVSTIEHVGHDNRVYGSEDERDEAGIPQALRELRRVGGRILLTVPTGAKEDHGWFVQLDADTWRRLFADAALEIVEEEVYELTPQGWRAADGDAVDARYGERGPAASAVFCVELRALEESPV